jgi:hypothetical protein
MAHRLIARYRHLAVALTRLTSRGSVGEWPSPSLCWLWFYRIVDAAYERRSIAVTSNIHSSTREVT